MLYDLQPDHAHGGETNYITATLALYLDIFNVFAEPAGAAGASRQQRLIAGFAAYAEASAFGRRLFISRKSAMDSTCPVCGNMLTTPAAASGGSPSRSRARRRHARALRGCTRRRRFATGPARAGALQISSAPSRGGSMRSLSTWPRRARARPRHRCRGRARRSARDPRGRWRARSPRRVRTSAGRAFHADHVSAARSRAAA